ncbi:MAG: pyridoxal phosphate-dependent aminotransferase, partial [Rhodospirillales bacterium]|nr:pyridoxal phosphate-dependent aminotransferase [Rhodospirillales bacterium]
YLWCEISRLSNDSLAFAATMLQAAGIAATPGVDFDPGRGGRYLRFSYCGAPEDMAAAPGRLQAWLGR